ncbi:hypothetical protein MalM14_38210 [Gimesia chilikensis]|nr:hypothetical protein MalM14_38210 [Gimesia chilikensis]
MASCGGNLLRIYSGYRRLATCRSGFFSWIGGFMGALVFFKWELVVNELLFCFYVEFCGRARGRQDRILSRCGRILSPFVPDFVRVWPECVLVCHEQGKGTGRTGWGETGGLVVKKGVSSAADSSVVPTVLVDVNVPRARARRDQHTHREGRFKSCLFSISSVKIPQSGRGK